MGLVLIRSKKTVSRQIFVLLKANCFNNNIEKCWDYASRKNIAEKAGNEKEIQQTKNQLENARQNIQHAHDALFTTLNEGKEIEVKIDPIYNEKISAPYFACCVG